MSLLWSSSLVHRVQQLVEGLGEDLFHLGQLAGGTDAGDDVLALSVGEELAVQLLAAGRRVAGEADAGGGGLAAVAEHHLLHVDSGAEVARDAVGPAVELGARVQPRLEDRVDRAVELLAGIRGPLATERLVGERLERGGQLLEVLSGEVGVERNATGVLDRRQRVLEDVGLDALDDLAVHLDEAAVAVVREPLAAELLDDAGNRLVGDAEVEDRVHHAGHRLDGAGADGDEQRAGGGAELAARALLKAGQAGLYLLSEAGGPFAVVVHGIDTGSGRDRECIGNRNADLGHVGQSRALAAEQRLHGHVTFGQVVDVLRVSHVCTDSPRRQLLRLCATSLGRGSRSRRRSFESARCDRGQPIHWARDVRPWVPACESPVQGTLRPTVAL